MTTRLLSTRADDAKTSRRGGKRYPADRLNQTDRAHNLDGTAAW